MLKKMNKILSVLLIAVLAVTAVAQTTHSRQRMVVNLGGKTVVYDVSRLDSVTFDQVAPVSVPLELVSVAGYSVKVSSLL